MAENKYTITIDTAEAQSKIKDLLDSVKQLEQALKGVSSQMKGGILSNPQVVNGLSAVSNAQTGGGGGGTSTAQASVGVAQAAAVGVSAPSVATTGTAPGTTTPISTVTAPPATAPGGHTGLPSAPSGQTTGRAPGTGRAGASYSAIEAAVTAAQAAHEADPTPDTAYALAQAQSRMDRANRMVTPAAQGPFDWSSSQFARTGTGFIAGQALVTQATGWMGIASQETISGGYNIQGRSRQAGEGIGMVAGAVIGGLIGSLIPGGTVAGALIGGGFGSQVIGAMAEWSTAPAAAELDAFSAMLPSARVGGAPRMSQFEAMQSRMKSTKNPLLQPNAAQITGAWSALQGGAAQSGFPHLKGAYRASNADMRGVLFGNPPEGVAYDLTQVLGLQYGNEAMGPIAKEQAGILGSLAETGQNAADILSRFGSMATSRYYTMLGGTDARSLIGITNASPYTSALSSTALSQAAARTATAERQARLGSYKMTGSGAAVYGALGNEMKAISALPEGTESESYAHAASQQRDAQMVMYGQQDIMQYGIPQTRLAAQRGVLNALPYAPGYRFGVELQSIALNRQQIGAVQHRLAAGNLTEDQRLKLEEQLGNLQVSTASSMATITEGVENRLPALAAGRPSRFSRLDSNQMAAMQVGRMGFPTRVFGATSGRQLQQQDEFVNSLLGPGGTSMIAGQSRDMPVNGSRVENLLERIAQILSQMGGAGQGPRTRVGEAANKGQAIATGNPAPTYSKDFN